MKFIVERTSGRDYRPCPIVQEDNIVYVESYPYASPDEVPAYYNRPKHWWIIKGFNHRYEDGCIKRDIYMPIWTLEINTMEELMEFSKNYGRLVIEDHPHFDGYKRLEIYDWWRE